jgi:EmrB/QacA subfamily drug resistance transporter
MAKVNASAAKSQSEKLDPLVVKMAVILVIGALAPLLDSTMVNVAIKTIVGDLKSTISVVQWVTTGYVLAMGIAVPVSGWATSRFGGKRVYMFSLLLFFIGSLLSSLAWNIDCLIVFRFLQGLGAGLMMPTMQTMLVQIAGGRNLGRVISIVSIPALLGPILGPVLGGVIVNSLSWRWIFYVDIPICIVAFWLAWRGVPTDEPIDRAQSLDVIGVLLLFLTFVLLIFGISMIKTQGSLTSSAVIIPLGSGLLLMAAFIIYALRTKNTPVLDLHLFTSQNFSASSVMLILTGIITNGAMLLLPLYYQQVRGESVLFAGLLLIPQGVGMLLTRSYFGNLTDRIGSRLIVLVSLVITTVGTLPFAFAGPDSNQFLLAAALLIRGAGLGGLFIPVMASAYTGLSRDQVPHASIATRIFQTIGGAFGSAILATILQRQLSSSTQATIQSVAGAYNVAFWWSIGFTVAAVVPALFLSLRKTEPAAVPA